MRIPNGCRSIALVRRVYRQRLALAPRSARVLSTGAGGRELFRHKKIHWVLPVVMSIGPRTSNTMNIAALRWIVQRKA